MSAEMFGPASLVMAQGISSFTTFLPPLSDVRKAASSDPNVAGDVRLGEVAAVALTVGLGAVASSLVGSPTPAYVAVLVSLGLVVLYECALRADRPLDPKPFVRRAEEENA